MYHQLVKTRAVSVGQAMLSPYRVLELKGEGVLLSGQIPADLGADVIVFEPPDGARAGA